MPRQDGRMIEPIPVVAVCIDNKAVTFFNFGGYSCRIPWSAYSDDSHELQVHTPKQH